MTKYPPERVSRAGKEPRAQGNLESRNLAQMNVIADIEGYLTVDCEAMYK